MIIPILIVVGLMGLILWLSLTSGPIDMSKDWENGGRERFIRSLKDKY